MSAFPFPPHWKTPERFEEILELEGLKIHMVGLAAEHKDTGVMVTGSAAQLGESPWDRSFFELLERISVVDALQSSERTWDLRDRSGATRGVISHKALFPQSESPERWRYSKSNGVAIHLAWNEAALAAHRELVERDRILRSWFGEIVPFKTLTEWPMLLPLQRHYDFESYLFPSQVSGAMEVAAFFGFPKSATIPRVYGFSARESEQAAIEGAMRECLQVLAFLWGEDFSGEMEFSPTPEYHQEYFLRPAGVEKLREWLQGGHFRRPAGAISTEISPLFVDITPPYLRSKATVVKALSSEAKPLAFGYCGLPVFARFPEELLIHPIV